MREGRITMAPKIIAVCGIKNSGKTTLVTKLIRELTKKGCKVAAIKHDGHDFCPDVPGTDSYRMREAGAYGTAVFSSRRFFVYKEAENINERKLINMFPESDVILLEGFKHTAYPKLEIVRNGIAAKPSAKEEGLLAVITDIPGFTSERYPVLNLNDVDGIVRFITDGLK